MARILCIDDEPHVVTLKCAILQAAGHVVTAATSAREAIEKLQANTYDAVVTDYVAEAFQAAEPLADLYLEKPVNPEELVTIVNELLKTSDKNISR